MVKLDNGGSEVNKLQQLANKLYSKVYGDIDDKSFRAKTTGEIYDWLYEGNLDDEPTVDQLAKEWQEYNK